MNENGQTKHVCNCNHTTSFALLITIDEVKFCETCEKILFYVSLIGISLSLFGLSLTIGFSFLISFIDSRSDQNRTTIVNLNQYQLSRHIMSKQLLHLITIWCFSLVGMNVFYIVMSSVGNSASSYEALKTGSCIVIGVMLHYFLLASFFFSLSISILLYLTAFILRSYSNVFSKACAFSLGKFLIDFFNCASSVCLNL